jgi:hypothetical protein
VHRAAAPKTPRLPLTGPVDDGHGDPGDDRAAIAEPDQRVAARVDERLAHQVVGDLTAQPPGDVPVDVGGVPVVQPANASGSCQDCSISVASSACSRVGAITVAPFIGCVMRGA